MNIGKDNSIFHRSVNFIGTKVIDSNLEYLNNLISG